MDVQSLSKTNLEISENQCAFEICVISVLFSISTFTK